MAFAYINEPDLCTMYEDSKKFMQPLFDPLDEFERIARNRPHPGIAKNLPKVTDGTLAATIQETPKRIIQQIPTGKILSDTEWLNTVAGYILEHEILPYSNQTAALIQKCWALVTKSLTYGSQPAFVQFVNRGEYFGTDFTLPYIKDVLLEPGKLSDQDSNVIMLRSWYSPGQIDAIIAKEKMLAARAKDRGEKYEGSWDLTELANLKDEKAEKPSESQTPNERGKSQPTGYIEIVHVFQTGVGATFYSFSPRTKEVVRRKTNKDPRGVIPIHYMYMNIDLSNPLGRGAVEMSGGMQNLLDSEVQSYQFMRTLMMAPPIIKKGNFSKSVLKYVPNAVWDLGSDANADAKPAQLETQSLQQFPNNYGLIKSQILNLNSGGTDNAISSTAGDPQSSKTPAGVQSQQARLSISDNYMRKQFEDAFQDICETEVNLYFAERSGTQELTLDKETAAKVEKLQPGATQNNVIRINYDEETPKLKFRVDASTSSIKDNQTQLEALSGLLERIEGSPLLQQIVGQDKVKETWNAIVGVSGIENPEKLRINEDEEGQQQPQSATPEMVQQMIQQAMEQAKDQPKPLSETLNIKFTDLPGDAQRQILARELGIESADPLPSELSTAQQVDESGLQAAQQAHQQHMDTADMALKLAQAHHGAQQDTMTADRSHMLNASDAALRVAQAQQPKEVPSGNK